MKRWLTLTLLLATGLAQATPEFQDAEQFDLNRYQGQVVYVDFWASWCPPCRESFPWLIEMQDKYAADGLRVLAVNVDTDRPAIDRFLSGQPTNFPIILDPAGQIAERYALMGMPSAVLIGADGREIFQHTGFRAQDKRALEQAIAKAVAAVEAP